MRKVKLIRIEKDAAEAASKQLKKNYNKNVRHESLVPLLFFGNLSQLLQFFGSTEIFAPVTPTSQNRGRNLDYFFGPKLERKLSRLDQLMYQHVDPTAHERVT
jgi:hypothetical protein